jgi:hypothetical protein
MGANEGITVSANMEGEYCILFRSNIISDPLQLNQGASDIPRQ